MGNSGWCSDQKTRHREDKAHVVKGSSQSIYEEESNNTKQLQEKTEKVIRFLWDGNTLLHEWEEDNTVNRIKPKSKVDYKADFVLKLEKKEEEKARQEAERGQSPPDSLITWIFQDDFIPRGKITRDGSYSIISDYLGTPVEAYDEEGNKVWERELDIYGRVKKGRKDIYGRTEKEIGEKNFIPFRFQGQYEDEEIGLYYNRFRYYSPEAGCYTQQDPIGLAGGNPTIYGYVHDSNWWIDLFGLTGIDIFRGMTDSDGKPKIGTSARTLGVRPNVDIPVDGNGMVYPRTGGMSVSPSQNDLPSHRKPSEFGGTGKDPIWKMNTSDLGPELDYVPDKPGHGTIQPAKTMSLEDYEKALTDTQKDWETVECH